MNFETAGDGQDCYSIPHPYDKAKATLDSENQSAFYPEFDGFTSYKAEFKAVDDFWVSLSMQTGFNNCTNLSISKWSEVNEQLQLLKDLNRMTHDAIKFIERHQLQKRRG
jgi:hypothetical protein